MQIFRLSAGGSLHSVQVYGLFFGMLTATQSIESCEEAFSAGAQWFEAWAGAGRGDVDAAEMTVIVQQVSCSSMLRCSNIVTATCNQC